MTFAETQASIETFAGIVLAMLGADVVLTDLGPNLPLLKDNCLVNGKPCYDAEPSLPKKGDRQSSMG